ncbi:MAG: hypothetical protein VX000_01620, partial [Myxococcota bacterium]|nr:hypothetical protein [Myxococcota bacterium]
MSEPLSRIRRSLDTLVMRERRFLGLRAVLQAGVAVGASLALLAGLYSAGVEQQRGLGATIFFLVATLILALALPAVFRWRDAGDVRVQARRVESLRPALQGRLLAALDRGVASAPGAKPAPMGVSKVLLERASSSAADLLDGVPSREVHPSRPVTRTAGMLMLAVAALLGFELFLPVGPLDALAVASGESAAAARMQSASAVVADQEAVVGDI